MIKITNLGKIYPGAETTTALKDINLEIKEGEVLAFSGPSGSGKTTLLNLIGCLDSITKGEIFVDEVALSKLDEKQKCCLRQTKLGFIFQNYNLIPVLSARENVLLSLEVLSEEKLKELGLSKKDKKGLAKRADEFLAEVGLKEKVNRKPGQLSGGEQQRVAIARALVKEPKYILADEPTANLDSINSQMVLDLIIRLNKKLNATCIFSSHDKKVIDHVERVLYLEDGRILKDEKNV